MLITPNLRVVKPLTVYTRKRIKMYGRNRPADIYEQAASGQATVTLPFTPDSAELLEVYNNSIRLVDGYLVSGKTVTFNPPITGTLKFISDTAIPDMGEKWLYFDIKNLLHYDDLDNTAFGTDRREGPLIATHHKPICITQGALGYMRPSPNPDVLLYCPYYGMYGRDSVTYAIQGDTGQLSDFRCIEIRVRDPNFIPVCRFAAVSATSNPLKIGEEVVDIVPNGTYQIYGETPTDSVIQLPNKTSKNQLEEFHFIIQGKDEAGEWFELEEYFEEDEYQVQLPNNEDFVVTFFGKSEMFGFDNGTRITVMCKRTGLQGEISVNVKERTIFRATITSSKTKDIATLPRTLDANGRVTLTKNGTADDEAIWSYLDGWQGPNGITLTTVWENPVVETRNVSARVTANISIDVPMYDPVKKAPAVNVFDVSRTIPGTFRTALNPADNRVTVADAQIEFMPVSYFWESEDAFSPTYFCDGLNYTYKNIWTIAVKEVVQE